MYCPTAFTTPEAYTLWVTSPTVGLISSVSFLEQEILIKKNIESNDTAEALILDAFKKY